MNENSVTEMTHESWFSRLGGAIKGLFIGLVLFLLAFPLLFWNEGRAVKRQKTLSEGAAAVISVAADKVAPANADKLVHTSGQATTSETLTDALFGVTAKAIHLQRAVVMYQWREESESKSEKKLGGGTDTTKTYTYSRVWEEDLIDSSKFKQPDGHQNPAAMPCRSEEWSAKEVHLGAFQLSSTLIDKICRYTPLSAGAAGVMSNATLGVLQADNSGFYRGRNPAAPEIGDVRVTFEQVEPAEISVVAQQNGTTLSPYATRAGGTIELLQSGVQSAAAMFQSAQQGNRMLTWILRGVGFVVMLIGLSMVLKPMAVLADVVPFFGNLVQAGTGMIAFLAALALSSLTIAIAWIVYRPVLGILLLVVTGAVAFALKSRLHRSQPQPATPPPQPELQA